MTKTVVIDRSKWRTGGVGINATGEGQTKLLNEEGFMCCLGFMCKSHKIKTLGLGAPSGTRKVPLLTELNDVNPNLFSTTDHPKYKNTTLCEQAMNINDSEVTSREEKEERLKSLFEGKLELVFTGESVKRKKEEKYV